MCKLAKMKRRTIYNSKIYSWVCLMSLAIGFGACTEDKPKGPNPQAKPTRTHTHFELLSSEQTGVNFNNQVVDGKDFNGLTYRNFYNGGGVAIGDINNDGLPDLYFTANQSANKLFLNKGNFTFEDITGKSGVGGTKSWSTGVTMADVNGDGLLDIYVSNSGDVKGSDKENELFINKGNLAFEEEAARYGLNNKGYSTQAVFFDYDVDGDLDCYLLNNSFKDPGKIELYRSMRNKPDELGGDKLYRNDGGKFTDVTLKAGIYSSEIGFGLGAAVGDLNRDNLPDIYISNDFWERDYLYMNQGDGTFSEELIDRINLASTSSMGGDIADINNDGSPEIFSTDMLPGDNYRIKTMTAFDPYHLEDMKYRSNYHYQFLQNCLHLNDGSGKFQEIAQLSGVSATDWSWGALIFDFENDGNKDLFVSNGISRDLMSMDFRDFMTQNNLYRNIGKEENVDIRELISQMPSNPLSNYAFANTGDLRFENQAAKLGLDKASFSNGSAYADLDNDGDMDLVVNNVNMPAFLYRNEANTLLTNSYLKVKFKGSGKNTFGIGARIDVRAGTNQTFENYNSRGFQSSIEPSILVGLGSAEEADELKVTWPDKKIQILRKVKAGQTLILDYKDAWDDEKIVDYGSSEFTNISENSLLGDSRHRENRYNDFDHEVLLLNLLSTEGPRLIRGDVNQDGLEDFMALGANGDEDKLFIQTAEGTFRRKPSATFRDKSIKAFESTSGVFYDDDGDGDLDLMLGSGGNEYQRGGKYFILRFYENDGAGNFSIKNQDVPQIVGSFSVILAEDVDQDGDIDLFFGARSVPGNYGLLPRSFLFKKSEGKWIDETPEALSGVGMVTDASWEDIDGDQDKDLLVVGEWMAIQVFKNEGGTLNQTLYPGLQNSEGWWTRIVPADLDKDGDLDFVVGNWGLNSKFKASVTQPLTMYVNDFDANGKSEFVINWYAPEEDKAYPFATKPDLTQQLPQLRKTILKYDAYARQTYETLFPADIRSQSIPYKANYMETSILWNEGSNFSLMPLPVEAQVSPVFGIVAADLMGDGNIDIWLGGNFYGMKPQVGRHDASRGVFLMGNGSRTFNYLPYHYTGIYVEGEVREAMLIPTSAGKKLIVSRNNDEIQVFGEK